MIRVLKIRYRPFIYGCSVFVYILGYGHVAPKTTHGRMITIVYALVGIPLTFLYLSNMGNAMAKCFRLFYKKVYFVFSFMHFIYCIKIMFPV